jgi:ribosomal protein S18 acetylase RimI-like enzyme
VSGVVVTAEDAKAALDAVGSFLRSDPVQHNLVLTLLEARAAHPEPGRYAWVLDDDEIAGLAFHSPLDFHVVVTALPVTTIETLVDRLADEWADIPGVFGPAESASRFAGRWAEVLNVPARPVEGQRLYELGSLHPVIGVPGTARPAGADDAELIMSWVHGFEADTGVPVATADAVRRRVDAGLIWIWDHDQPVAMAAYTPTVAGVSRIGLVYTPPAHRRRGYGAACTAAVTGVALEAGAQRCVLYTQLHNPQSNAIYRRLGYRPVSEHVRYEVTAH